MTTGKESLCDALRRKLSDETSVAHASFTRAMEAQDARGQAFFNGRYQALHDAILWLDEEERRV